MRVVNSITYGAPLRWLRFALDDLRVAPVATLAYGAIVAALSFGIWRALIESDLAFWALSLSCGFVFVAPILAMGLYEAGRALENGENPNLIHMLAVRRAMRSDVFYLGAALLFIYLFWGRIAQLVYGLSTYRLHTKMSEFFAFAFQTTEGHSMLIAGTIVGGVLAFFTFAMVVVSAPMLMDQRSNVFEAIFVSLSAVARNFGPLLFWAALITTLLIVCALTSWLGLVLVFPWLGLASWRAYRDLVVAESEGSSSTHVG